MVQQGVLLFSNQAQRRPDKIRVAGLSLLERGIRTLARTGIKKLLVLVPPGTKLKLGSVTQKLELELEFLTLGDQGGAAGPLAEDFLLVLGDHVHHHAGLSELVTAGLEDNDLCAQVSDPIQRHVALNQVSATANAIAFNTTQTPTKTVSTGAFLCTANLFSAKDLVQQSDFLTFLTQRAAGGKIALRPSAVPLWRRVTDRRGARAAKKMLFTQVTKKTSGFVSRHLNARISIPTSKLLIETGASPHLVTVLLVMPTGLASAYFMLFPDEYPKLFMAGLLWHLAAVFDRCDGEIARVKLCESKFGAWFDTVTDNIAYICASFGFMIGFRKLYPEPIYLYIGLWSISALVLYLVVMYIYLWKTGSGSLQQFTVNLSRDVDEADKGILYRLMQRITFMAKRDFFSFVYFLTAIANRSEIFYFIGVLLFNTVLFAAVIAQSKMRRKARRTATSGG